MNKDINIINLSFENKHWLEHTNKCGCIYCQKIFSPDKIKDWTDQGMTAVCPYCGIDSIIPELEEYEITPTILKELHDERF